MKSFKSIIHLIGIVFLSGNIFADVPNWDNIQKSIQDKMNAAHISGLQMSYQDQDGTQHDFNLGTTDLTGSNAVTDETRFYSASLTKMFTAISLFQLREKGLLKFDDKIINHLTYLRNSASSQMRVVTIKQMMSHTSGMARNGEQFWTDPDLILQGKAPTQVDVLNAALNQRFGVLPEVQLKYSNLGYELLGLVVGKLCTDCRGSSYQERYADYIRKYILKPLNMTKSGFNPSTKTMAHFATPYQLADAQGNRNPLALIKTAGASVGAWGLYSTSKDMIKFVKELGLIISQQKNVLVKKNISTEVSTAVLNDSLNSSLSHSLGFRLIKVVDANKNTGYLVGHTGTFPGFSSAAFYNTLTKSSAVVYFNVIDGGGVGFLLLAATPTSGITQLPGTSSFSPQEEQETLINNPYAGIVKKWSSIYGSSEVIYEGDRYFLRQSGQKVPLYIKMSEDKKSIDGYIGTNSGYLDFIGDAIHFDLDSQGNSESALVAKSALWRATR